MDKALSIKECYKGKERNLELASAYHRQGCLFSNLKEIKKAYEFFDKSFKLRKEHYKNIDHPDMGEIFSCLGNVYEASKRKEDAEKLYKSAERSILRFFGEKHSKMSDSYVNFAVI
mmetsp:Transcript_2866/g.2474  ORF Transcript_2866/g.2474 Transcript_2866/m.2474 type:complete len:116 (+) Transcript_2866:597-944(+)